MSPRKPTFISISQKYWNKQTDGGHRYSTEEWRNKYATELLGLFPHGGTMLDIGCGACELTTYIAPEFTKVYAVDYSPSMLDAARKRIESGGVRNIELFDGTAQAFPREVEKVDVILSSGLIQYFTLSDLDVHLRECQRVLDKKGVVCIADIPDVASKRVYYRTTLMPSRSQQLTASLPRELHMMRLRVNAFVRKDPLWDGIGNWFSRSEIEAAAERSGFYCELRNSWFYDYRMHALLSRKS
jgi:cyclopropane-fatty-acyl-phospholipid synthase